MPSEKDIRGQAAELGKMLLKENKSEIINHAEELLVFLNHLQDLRHCNMKSRIPFSGLSDVIYGLESDPESTLNDQKIRSRLINLFEMLAKP